MLSMRLTENAIHMRSEHGSHKRQSAALSVYAGDGNVNSGFGPIHGPRRLPDRGNSLMSKLIYRRPTLCEPLR